MAENDTDTTEYDDRSGYCTMPAVEPLELPAGMDPFRASAIIVNRSKWANGTKLRYYFFDRDTDGENVVLADGSTRFRSWVGDEPHRDLVRAAFATWKSLDIGLDFLEVQDRSEAEIRIGFMQGDGSWSYVGRDDILGAGPNERTMNFGWRLVGSPDGEDTALHEIGHTFGLPHEHQNPNAGIVWNEEEVYRRLAGPPNSWSRQKTHWNIIRKLDPDTVQGSSWDPDSVMHYPFEAGMISVPEQYRLQPLVPAGGLSARDTAWVRTFYPPLEAAIPELVPFTSVPMTLEPSEQRNFRIRPSATRPYTIQTFGQVDTVLVLFENVNGELRFRAGDDDSGFDRNASVTVKMFQGREYVVRLRHYYSWGSGSTAVMLW
jgi:hypothetical protein